MDGTVLVADDDRTIRTVLTQALTRAGCKVHATSSLQTLLRWVGEGKGDLVITDVVMPDGNGLTALPHIARLRPGLPVIVISAQNSIVTAIRAAEAAAFDYLPKPFDLPDLMKRAAKGLAGGATGAMSAPAPGQPAPDQIQGPIIGQSPVMQALYKLLARMMSTDLPLMVLGESGTGKSLVARALHDLSDRNGGTFVTVQAEDLDRADGFLLLAGRAQGGTLVIENPADFDAATQGRLAQALDRLEGAVPGAPPRLVSTGGPGAEAAIRPDLFYRLAGMTLTVPPLRDRPEDLGPLAAHLLARAAAAGLPARTLSPEAAAGLGAHGWPGNVRELENVMRRLAALCPDEVIGAATISGELTEVEPDGPAEPASGPGPATPDTLASAVERHIRTFLAAHHDGMAPSDIYDRVLAEVERPLIQLTLAATRGNQIRAASMLGLNRNTLRKKIRDLEIPVVRGLS